MALTVSLSKEFDKHCISWDGFGGLGGPPNPSPAYLSVYKFWFLQPRSHKPSRCACSPALPHSWLAYISGPVEPMAAFWQASSCWFLSLIFNLALWEKFCFPSCLLLNYVLTSAFSLFLCCLSGRCVLFLIQRQLTGRNGKSSLRLEKEP